MVPLNERERRRDRRRTWQGLALAFVLMPVMAAVDGRDADTFAGALFVGAIGVAIFAWQRRHPLPWPTHYAAVDHVDDEYVAWCDCLWQGEPHGDEESARNEARTHTEHVRDGLHVWGE